MLQRCSVCSHPSRPEIDRGLLQGVPCRSLGDQFGLSPSALCRHTRPLARYPDREPRRRTPPARPPSWNNGNSWIPA